MEGVGQEAGAFGAFQLKWLGGQLWGGAGMGEAGKGNALCRALSAAGFL